MWYTAAYKWNTHYSRALDETIYQQDWDEVLSLERGAFVGARVHGHPSFDTMDIGWQGSTAGMRDQMAAYGGEDVSRDAATSRYKEFFDVMPACYDHGAGFHIIDADDPELVEHGELYVHERLTNYLAEPLRDREGSPEHWTRYIGRYVDTLFLNNMQSGTVIGGLLLEVFRQRVGQLPYEWDGAPID